MHVSETARALHDKSKKSLIGDGTYPGFVLAVLGNVPNAVSPGPNAAAEAFGHLIYMQTAGTVNRRLTDIMPGDLISFVDAKLKGHKGLHHYSQTVGTGGEFVIGVVSEFETKKSKVKVYQANQHVGAQVSPWLRYCCTIAFNAYAIHS